MRSFTIVPLIAILSGLACSSETPVAEPNEPITEASTKSALSILTTREPEMSLRQRIDAITLWPEVQRSRLIPLLTKSTTFHAVGVPDSELKGTRDILNALKGLQSAPKPWRVSASRGTQTASRIAVELELLRCSKPEDVLCEDRREALLFASVENDVVKDARLYLNTTWRRNSKKPEAQRPVRWVAGRRNPNLEKAFGEIWTGDLKKLLGPNFRFIDKATGREIRGKDAFIAHRTRYAQFMNDGQCRAQEIHSAGDIVIALSICEGVFTRDVRGKGRKVKVHVADIARFKGTKMVELNSYSNHDEANAQLGIIKAGTQGNPSSNK